MFHYYNYYHLITDMMKSQSAHVFFGLFLVLLLSAEQTMAQSGYASRNFFELRIGTGPSVFFGDLGGSQGTGKRAMLDLDLGSIGPNAGLGIKFNVLPSVSLRADINHTRLSGNDADSENKDRFTRNLSFRTDLTEVSATAEVRLIDLSKWRRLRNRTGVVYFFTGVGMFWFDPQAEYNGQWHHLQPLGTEGQGLPGKPDLYSRVSYSIPYGVGVQRAFGKNSTLGIELSMRKSFTDYIDDVSGSYGDKEAIRAERGDVAAALSDRSLGEPRNRAGIMRGNPTQNDNFSFLQLTYSLSIGKKKASWSKSVRKFNSMDAAWRCPVF